MTTQDDLDQAVKAARFAVIDPFGLMLAHGLDFPTMDLMLEPGWPEIVKRTYQEWVTQMNEVAEVLAVREGIAPGTRLSGKDRLAFTHRVFDMVMD